MVLGPSSKVSATALERGAFVGSGTICSDISGTLAAASATPPGTGVTADAETAAPVTALPAVLAGSLLSPASPTNPRAALTPNATKRMAATITPPLVR